MQKVISKDFRRTKEFTLPLSGITVNCYSSILVKDLAELSERSDSKKLDIEAVVRCIKEWNLFASETDEKPLAISVENISRIPSPDLIFLAEQLKEFSAEQKKS